MAKRRKKIPRNIEAEILFLNDKTCCICRDSTKGVQIHHIDGNPNNNDLSNLAVVCTEHHDEIHKSGRITKGISPTLLRKYKRSWELAVRNRRAQQHGPLRSPLGIESTLFEFEIRRIVYEIVSLQDSDIAGINQRLDFLHTLYLLEGYTEQILRDLDHIHVMLSSEQNKACLISKKVPEFFYHLVGPEKVEVKEKDIDNLEIAIQIVGTIGSFAAEFNKSVKIIKSVSNAFENIWNILIWYDLESLALAILDRIDEISKGCKIVYEDEAPLVLGISELSNLCEQLKAITDEEQPEWNKVLTKLEKQIG
ncbi:MAG: HNH endonuclease signature motif containing protein [Anaerolineae bacterium]